MAAIAGHVIKAPLGKGPFVKTFTLVLSFFALITSVQAKTLLISDVDDTLKLSHVLSPTGAARYALDSESRFTGMSELFNFLRVDQPDMEFAYVSAAPAYPMGIVHRAFLANAYFPKGDYFPREWGSSEAHKLAKIRELINRHQPTQVILVGDNGNSDAEIYAQISKEYSGWGVVFFQFIRVAYSTESPKEKGKPVLPEQVGYVTPLEIAITLNKAQVLKDSSLNWILDNITSEILNEKVDENGRGVLTFPPYINCHQYQWRWDEYLKLHPALSDLNTHINGRCYLNL